MKKPLAVLFLSLALCCGASAANTLSSIQTLTGTTDTDQETDVTITGGTALDKMFHFCSFESTSTSSAHDQLSKATELTSISNLRIHNGQASGNVAMDFVCYVVIFTAASDLVTQRDTTNMSAGECVGNVISAVTIAETFVIPHGATNASDTSFGQEEHHRVILTTTTNVDVCIDDAADETQTFRFEVVDWNDANIVVQHVSATLGSGESSDTITITAVDLSRTWLIATMRTSAGSFTDQSNHLSGRVDFSSTTVVRYRKSGTGRVIEWAVQVIEDTNSPSLWTTQLDSIALADTVGSGTATLTAVTVANTFILGSLYPNWDAVGESDSTATGVPNKYNMKIELTSSTETTASRGVTTGALDLIVQAVEFTAAAADDDLMIIMAGLQRQIDTINSKLENVVSVLRAN